MSELDLLFQEDPELEEKIKSNALQNDTSKYSPTYIDIIVTFIVRWFRWIFI